MGDRTVPFDVDAICDVCGEKGAFDFYGDYICADCLEKEYIEDTEDIEDDE